MVFRVILIVLAYLWIVDPMPMAMTRDCSAGQSDTSSSPGAKPAVSSQSPVQSGSNPNAYREAFNVLPELNGGLPPSDHPPDLRTPQSSLANFVDSCRDGDYQRAARSLNLNGLDPEQQVKEGPRRAEQLKKVLEQKLWIDWSAVPDRPDGRTFGLSFTNQARGTTNTGPERFFHLGSIALDDRDVQVWMQRVKVPESEPIWVFSKWTVDAIPALYGAYGPSWLERKMPFPLRDVKPFGIALWQWIGFVPFLIIGWGAGRGVQWLLYRALNNRSSHWSMALAWSIQGPVAMIIGLIVFRSLAINVLRLAGPVMTIIEPLVFILIVLSVTWLLQRALNFTTSRLIHRYQNQERDAEALSMLTRIKMGKHFLAFVVFVVGLIVAFWQFEWFRAIGYGLLASAGLMVLVLGVAAQRPLSNLFAGVQMAITQPVRVGDAVVFLGEWGWVEEITMTYVVIRVWDLRRLVVPSATLIDETIENWTKGGSNTTYPIYLYVDYGADIAAIRNQFEDILNNANDYDKSVPPILQVSGWKDDVLELRALCSGKDPVTAWNLHCLVREQLAAKLRTMNGGANLPKTRVSLIEESAHANGEQHVEDSKSKPNLSSESSRTKSEAKTAQAAREGKIGGDTEGGDGKS